VPWPPPGGIVGSEGGRVNGLHGVGKGKTHMGSAPAVFLAVLVYGAIHSALLTDTARLALEAVAGSRVFRGTFRLAYNVLSAVLLAVLVAWAARLPDADLVRIPGIWAVVLWTVRLAALGFVGWCVHRIGGGGFLGLEHLRAWRAGLPSPAPGMEAGALVLDGPYRWVRHPMYAAGFVALWSEPVWTWNRLGFALGASVYLWVGSLLEERRLLRAFGPAYRAYMERTPRFIPRFRRVP